MSKTALAQDNSAKIVLDVNEAVNAALCAAEQEVRGLVRRVQAGETDAFGEIYKRYHPRIFRFIVGMVRDVTVAEDAASDTFTRALRSIRTFEGRGDFAGWLFKIAYNCVRAQQTSKCVLHEISFSNFAAGFNIEDTSNFGHPERSFDIVVNRAMLIAAIQQLSPIQRQCIVLRFFEGMELDEVAETLGRSPEHTAVLQCRALQLLACIIRTGSRPKMGRRTKKEKRDA